MTDTSNYATPLSRAMSRPTSKEDKSSQNPPNSWEGQLGGFKIGDIARTIYNEDYRVTIENIDFEKRLLFVRFQNDNSSGWFNPEIFIKLSG